MRPHEIFCSGATCSEVEGTTYTVGLDVFVEVALEVYDRLEPEFIHMFHHAAAAEIWVIHAQARRVHTTPPRNDASHGLDVAVRALGRLKVVVEVGLKGPFLRQRRLVRVYAQLGGTVRVRCPAPLLGSTRGPRLQRRHVPVPTAF
eukprot:350740-Rhodomonas_salina.1